MYGTHRFKAREVGVIYEKNKYSVSARPGIEAYLNKDGRVVLHQEDLVCGDDGYVFLDPDEVHIVCQWLSELAEQAFVNVCMAEPDDGAEE